MASNISTSITRRNMVAGLALSAFPIALAGADTASAQAKQPTPEKSLYERLGGVFAIAAVVDHFSDAIVERVTEFGVKMTRLYSGHQPRRFTLRTSSAYSVSQ